MSWHYLQEQEEVSSEGISWDGTQFVPLSGKTTLGEYCLPDSGTACCQDSPFGMTCAPSRERLGRGVFRSSAEDFHARTSPSAAQERDWTERNLVCGPRWRGLLGRFSQDSCSLKTPHYSLLGGSNEFSGTLPKWGMMLDGECLELTRPVLRIAAIESGSLLATPTATANQLSPSMMKHPGCRNWLPTSAVADWSPTNGEVYRTKTGTLRLKRADGRTSRMGLEAHVGGKLNPTWVEWLMGWPTGWTDLKPLAMDKYRQWQLSLGGY